jgi:molybdopterin-guanine dinucleotide biosynthesis protein A
MPLFRPPLGLAGKANVGILIPMNPKIRSSEIVGVILAGGRSSRMGGGDKCLVELAGRPLLAHAIERLQPQVVRLVINANGDPSRFAAFGLPVVPDRDGAFKGPLAGILAGMDWARSHAPGAGLIATAAADTPLFPGELVERMKLALTEKSRIAIASSGGHAHPVFGLFPMELADDLARFLDRSPKLAAMAWIDRHPWTSVEFQPANSQAVDPFLNMNTPDDLAAMQSEMAQKGLY